MNKRKIITGKPASQLEKKPYWRGGNDNITDRISKLPKPKAIAYFKVFRTVRGGTKTEIQYWKTMSDGYMKYVDVTNCRIGIALGLPNARGFEGTTKKEFDANFNKVLNILKS